MAVATDLDAVVVGHGHARAKHNCVHVSWLTDTVQINAAVEVALALGKQLGRDASHVVIGLATRHPGDGGVAAAVDRAFKYLTGGDIHDVEQGLLVASDRKLVRKPGALLRWLPRIECRATRGVQRHGIYEHSLAGRVDEVQHGELLSGLSPG